MLMSGSRLRTDVENVLYEEMVDEDANYLIMGDHDDDIEAVIPQNYTTGGVFDSASSEEDMDYNDDDVFQEVKYMLFNDILQDTPEDILLDGEAEELETAQDDVIADDGSDIDMIADISDDDVLAAEVDDAANGDTDDNDNDDNYEDNDNSENDDDYVDQSTDETTDDDNLDYYDDEEE